MNEGPKAITVKVKYDPNKDNTIDVKISPNTAVSDFEQAIKNELNKNNINDIQVELLKFNGQELDNKNKTLEQLGIKDGNSVENENRVVFIKTLNSKTIYITCDENTTVRESLKQLKDKNPEFSYIMLMLASTFLQRSTLDQKLLGCQVGKNSIKYGSTLYLIVPLEKNKNSDMGFDLDNLEEGKSSNLVKVPKTSEEKNNGSSVENENRVVFIKTLNGKTIYITCDENTTVRESLKQLRDKNLGFSYIRLTFSGKYLPRSTLDQKLLGCQVGKNSIKYGSTLNLILTSESNKNSDTAFDLDNLEEGKSSDLVKVPKTSKENNNVFKSKRLDDNSIISSDSKKESKNSNYPLLRIIVGIADLILLAAAVATFLLYFLTTLSLSVAFPIVLAASFVVGAILFFGWNTILPKILPKGCLKKLDSGIDLNKKYKNKIKETENNKEDDLKKEKNKEINSKSNEHEGELN